NGRVSWVNGRSNRIASTTAVSGIPLPEVTQKRRRSMRLAAFGKSQTTSPWSCSPGRNSRSSVKRLICNLCMHALRKNIDWKFVLHFRTPRNVPVKLHDPDDLGFLRVECGHQAAGHWNANLAAHALGMRFGRK